MPGAQEDGALGDRLAMQTLLRAQALGSLARSLVASRALKGDVADLNAIQLALPAEAVALVYLPGRFASSLFMVSRGELVHAPLAARMEFEEQAFSVMQRLPQLKLDAPDDTLDKALQSLREQLLPAPVLS